MTPGAAIAAPETANKVIITKTDRNGISDLMAPGSSFQGIFKTSHNKGNGKRGKGSIDMGRQVSEHMC
jgi:hypothetical protein